MGPKVILAADDEEVIRLVLQDSLSDENHQVVLAVDGEEAYQKAVDLRPDLLILDVRMPKKTGLEVCDALRRLGDDFEKIPVIILTGIDTNLGRRLGSEVGAQRYITKPFSVSDLKAEVRRLLGESAE